MAALLAMVSGLSKGNDPVGAAVVSFIIYVFCRGAGYVVFVALELAAEHWGWTLVVGLLIPGVVLK